LWLRSRSSTIAVVHRAPWVAAAKSSALTGGLAAAALAWTLVACAARPPAPQPPARLAESEAGKVILRAIEAHGGWASWVKASAAEYVWERPAPAPTDPPQRWRVSFDLHGGRVRIEDPASRTVQVWDGREAWSEPADAPLETPVRFTTRTEHFWFSLPWKLADPGARLELLEDEERDGKRCHRVRVTYEPGVGDTPQDWYIYSFNADSGLLEGVVFTVTFFGPEPGETGFTPYHGVWSDYVQAGGLRIASRRSFGRWNEGKAAEPPFSERLLEVQVGREPLPEAAFARTPAR
jgi:hypothetical protein